MAYGDCICDFGLDGGVAGVLRGRPFLTGVYLAAFFGFAFTTGTGSFSSSLRQIATSSSLNSSSSTTLGLAGLGFELEKSGAPLVVYFLEAAGVAITAA